MCPIQVINGKDHQRCFNDFSNSEQDKLIVLARHSLIAFYTSEEAPVIEVLYHLRMDGSDRPTSGMQLYNSFSDRNYNYYIQYVDITLRDKLIAKFLGSELVRDLSYADVEHPRFESYPCLYPIEDYNVKYIWIDKPRKVLTTRVMYLLEDVLPLFPDEFLTKIFMNADLIF